MFIFFTALLMTANLLASDFNQSGFDEATAKYRRGTNWGVLVLDSRDVEISENMLNRWNIPLHRIKGFNRRNYQPGHVYSKDIAVSNRRSSVFTFSEMVYLVGRQ